MSDDPDRYDLDTLDRFIQTVMYNRPSDDPGFLIHQKNCREKFELPEQTATPDMIAAAFALRDALRGVDLPKKFKLRPPTDVARRKNMGQGDDESGFGYVMAALNGEITREEAVKEIGRLFEFGFEFGGNTRAAHKYYDSVKKPARNTLNSIKMLHEIVPPKEDTARKVLQPVTVKLTAEHQAQQVCLNKLLSGAVKIKRIQAIFSFSYQEAQQYLTKNSPK